MGSLPVQAPSVSYWQAQAADSSIHDHGRRDPLPSGEQVADIAIIGSGISGAVAAYELQRTAPHLSVVMLEAREACSGATGRNGGHCRPDAFLGFNRYSEIVGKEQADKVLRNEWDTFTLIRDIIAREQIDCDWWEGHTMSVFLDHAMRSQAASSYESYQQHAPLRPGVRLVEDADEAAELSRIPGAVGAAVFPAGSLYPLRFVHALLSLCLARGPFQLFTHTPVLALHQLGPHWGVQTNRGTVMAKKVLLATNGYSRSLLPSLDDFLLSHRAHCSAIIPPPAYRGSQSLQSTCSIVRTEGDYEYLVPRRPGTDNAFILGGGNTQVKREEELDTYDDSYVNPSLPSYFAAYPQRTFAGWKGGEGELTHTWTGIQGYTRDSLPLVGRSFEHDGLFLCLGHHGHGMARAATCARGVAQLMLLPSQAEQTDDEWEKVTGLPSCYRWTAERAGRRDVDCRLDF